MKNYLEIWLLGLSLSNCFTILLSQTIFLSGLSNGRIQIWDHDSYSLLYTLTGHNSAVQSIEYLPDKYLASGYDNGIIIIWNLMNQTKHTELIHNGSVRSLILINDTTFASAASNSIKLWSIESFNNTLTIENAHSTDIIGLRFYSNNLFSISSDGILKSWNNFVFKFQNNTNCNVSSFALILNCTWAFGCKNGNIKIFSVGSNIISLIQILNQTDSVMSLSDIENKFLISGDLSGSLNLWDYKTLSKTIYDSANKSVFYALEYLKNGIILSGSDRGYITAWNMNNGTVIRELCVNSTVHVLKSLNIMEQILKPELNTSIEITNEFNKTGLEIYNRSEIWNITTEPLLKIFAVGLENGNTEVWEYDFEFTLFTLNDNSSAIQSIQFLPNNFLCSGDENGKITIWNFFNQIKHTELIHNGSVRSLILINDTTFASAASNSIKLWSIESFNNTLTIENAHSTDIISLRYFSNNLFSISSDGILKSWNNFVFKFQINTSCTVLSFDVDSNGILACGCRNGYIKIYSTDSFKLNFIKSLFNKNNVISLRFLETGFLVSGGINGTLNVWNYNESLNLLSYYGNNNTKISALEYINDGIFLSGNINGFIDAWDVNKNYSIKKLNANSQVNFIKFFDRKFFNSKLFRCCKSPV
ncbi:unnamed protein product [Brachionus calyciflorus]|uniref:Uncharacterized protein n=1 Tax=Brachionus calyciflorus TaxID=104777 RepID=A0A814J744_9BILA|nr:unnamed protein product [Brachionus calyciflorus]